MTRNDSPSKVVEPPKSAPRCASRLSEQAFTLVELGVVLVVIAVLGALLLPALAATHDRSNRAVCQYHLRQIGVVATQYAAENNDTFFSCGRYGVPIAINGLDASASAMVGLNTNGGSIWTCPDRLPGLPVYEPGVSPPQWTIGYQYYGGLTNWSIAAYGNFPSRSPVKLSQAKPYWALASDAMIKANQTTWASDYLATNDARYFVYGNIPPHGKAGNSAQGGNEGFCDGSVQWINWEKMYGLTGWGGYLVYATCYWYQDPRDFPPMGGPIPVNY